MKNIVISVSYLIFLCTAKLFAMEELEVPKQADAKIVADHFFRLVQTDLYSKDKFALGMLMSSSEYDDQVYSLGGEDLLKKDSPEIFHFMQFLRDSGF